MSPSHDAKSIQYSVHSSHHSEGAESWGTIHTGSRTPTPTHTSAPPTAAAHSHRSNPSYPSPSYGPGSPFSASSASSVYSPTLAGVQGWATPGAPVMGIVPLPHCSSTTWTTSKYQLCPLLHFPSPFVTFNLSQSLNHLLLNHGAIGALSDPATRPALPSMILKISFISSKINLPVSPRPGFNFVTVYDIFSALSIFMLSSPQSESQIASATQDAIVRGKSSSQARRARGDPRGTMWVDFLGQKLYFGGLVGTSTENVYEVWMESALGPVPQRKQFG